MAFRTKEETVMDKVRAASIGVGGMSGTHARLFTENPRVELVCVCDIVEEKARTQAEKLGCEGMTDYRKMLERDDIDAVMVGVPNMFHYPIALDALRAGKHTAVEYPICQTVEQYKTLAGEAEQRGLVVADVLTPVMEPQAMAIRELMPEIGKVMSTRSAYFAAGGSWYVNEEIRGNFYAALTIHQIIYCNVVLGESPDWVEGALHTYSRPDGHTFASGMYTCGYPSGVLAFNDWGMGFENSPSVWEWVIEGVDGRLVYDRPTGVPHRVRLQRKGSDDEVTEIEPQANVHPVAIENFVAQILDGAAPFASPETSIEILAICEAALEAAKTGRRVDLK